MLNWNGNLKFYGTFKSTIYCQKHDGKWFTHYKSTNIIQF